MRGRKPDKVERTEINIHIYIDGERLTIDKRIYKLAASASVVNQVNKIFALLSKGGIEKIKVLHPELESEELEISEKFDDISFSEEPSADFSFRSYKDESRYFKYARIEEELSDETKIMTLRIIGLSFEEIINGGLLMKVSLSAQK